MFLGYQGDKIVLTAQTRAELEKTPFIQMDKIEETTDNYLLWNGNFVKKENAVLNKDEISLKRAQKYTETTDKFLLENLEQAVDLESLFKLLTEWKDRKEKIRQEMPYL